MIKTKKLIKSMIETRNELKQRYKQEMSKTMIKTRNEYNW